MELGPIFLYFLWFFFLSATLVQCWFWIVFFKPLRQYQPDTPPFEGQENQGLSIVVCARNAAQLLTKNLPSLIEQQYPGPLEILVVNDASTDETKAVLEALSTTFPVLRAIHLTEKIGLGKKNALSTGIKSAKYDLILVTDADCKPNSVHWASKTQTVMNKSAATEIVLGFGPNWPEKGAIAAFIDYETIQTAILYFSFALNGMPYMGVGRNLCFKKGFFTRNQGFDHHAHLASGDDDLLVNSVSNSQNTNISLDPDTFMYSTQKQSIYAWIIQKKRHLSTGSQYQVRHKFWISIFHFSHCFYFAFGLGLLGFGADPVWVGLVFVLRMAIVQVSAKSILGKLNASRHWPYILILDGFYALYMGAIAPFLALTKPKRW